MICCELSYKLKEKDTNHICGILWSQHMLLSSKKRYTWLF